MSKHTHPKGARITYSQGDNQCPDDAGAIHASFSGGTCLTLCERRQVKVGSLACQTCDHYAGSQNYGIATGGDGRFGGADMTRDIYCRKPPVGV